VPKSFKRGNVNQHVCIIRPIQNKITTNFLHFELISQYGQVLIEISQNGANREGLNFQQIKNFVFALPPNAEQTTIANYLDAKITTIDRKIELLSAKADKYKALRRSLINETVCRGLNTDAPLKDSEVEWIGMIPEHWRVKRVKEIFFIGRGRVIGQDELVDEGIYPVYSSQTENNGCLGYIDTFDFNATLLTWTTDGANAGTLFKREGKFNCTNVCGTLKPKKRNENLDFILYILQIAAKHNKRIDTNGAKIMNNEMSIIPILYPPFEEQTAIANYLNEKTTQIDTVLTNIGEQINKLTQLRKTLINDVVTGKIKVTE
jgi:type I restriction enzyme S subunit